MIYLARTLLLGSWRGIEAGLIPGGVALAALAVGRFAPAAPPALPPAAPPAAPAPPAP
jgi:hypothetical protein